MKNFMKRAMAAVAATAVLFVLAVGCGSSPDGGAEVPADEPSAAEEAVIHPTAPDPPVETETEAPTPDILPTNTPKQLNDGSVGLTSANVRVYLEETEYTRRSYLYNQLFDLSAIEEYHEFIHGEPYSHRLVFTTESTVRDFKFLDIGFVEYSDIGGLYIERSVLYSLEELTPDTPLVVLWVNTACVALAGYGFSFVDDSDTVRYFSFMDSLKEVEDDVMPFFSVAEFTLLE